MLSSDTTPIPAQYTRFWQWFAKESATIFRFEQDRDRVLDALSDRLASIHPSLTFEIGPPEEGRRELILSADGDKNAFPYVVGLANSAPTLDLWEVIPFRPPKNLDRFPKVLFGGVELSVDDVWFTHETEGHIFHLDLFIPNLTDENHDTLAGAAFLLLDMALGEYVVETRIGGIEFRPLGESGQQMQRLRRIPSLVNLPEQ